MNELKQRLDEIIKKQDEILEELRKPKYNKNELTQEKQVSIEVLGKNEHYNPDPLNTPTANEIGDSESIEQPINKEPELVNYRCKNCYKTFTASESANMISCPFCSCGVCKKEPV